jgi:Pectic acid lyase.
MGGYHDDVAIADDATATILAVLRQVAHAHTSLSGSDSTLAPRAAAARARGVSCVLALQRRVDEIPAAWTFYYDPIDGTPLPGRSWEPAALAPLETASLLDELIADSLPSREAEWAAHGAAAWLARAGLSGYAYHDFDLTPVRGAAPSWPRLIALDDGRPLFSNRDGVPRGDWTQLTDRRSGYIWYGTGPAGVLERYRAWASTHPAWGALAPAKVPTDTVALLPGRAVERDTTSLVAPPRLRDRPRAEREGWARYVARSRELASLDRAAMDVELRAAGRSAMVRAPWSHDFSVTRAMTPAWFTTDSARRAAESILSYQTPTGGWSKHVNFWAGVRLPGMSYNGESADWRFIPTIDNSSTTEEIRFLALADAARGDVRYRAAIDAGVRYLLEAQMPTGCWPQVFPLEGGYHDAATFNDDAIVNVAQLMRDIAAGRLQVSAPELRGRARVAERGAIRCMLDAQVRANGQLTIWGQQHDPVTLRPTSARSYELASLGADESAHVASFLLATPGDDPRIARAVRSAANWFRANAMSDLVYERNQLAERAGAPPLWGRMVDLETGRPIFVNRDGVKSYDYSHLTDRRTGYRWFTAAPAEFLRDYERHTAAPAPASVHRNSPSSSRP